ncbi:MAG: acyl carrier protein [Paludibacteraceae bacterium]|nr:acyl carrier protein [Paludibacteraceae bacterium]
MDINAFMALIAEQYDDVDVAILTPQTEFRKVEGWTSLVALMIITTIDEEYGVVITGDEMKTTTTLQELYNLVVAKR